MREPHPSESSSPLATFRPGDRFGAYTIDHLLGIGGMACVYAATNREGQKVALKILRDDRADNPDVRSRFMQEARTGAHLHHPNIVRFVDFGAENHQLFLAMERVHGASLWQWVESPPPANELLDVFDQILDALSHAHARGVVHRDLKPDNILLEEGPNNRLRARLIDFGVAQHREALPDDELESSIVGTPEYMSPEQCIGSPTVSAPSDIYAVGVMIYELLSGRLPFTGSNPAATLLAHLQSPFPSFKARSAYVVPVSGEKVLRRFLAREPAERFPNAAAARVALRGLSVQDRHTVSSAAPSLSHAPIRRSEPPPITPGLFLVSDPPFVDLHDLLQDLQHRAQEHIKNDPRPMALLVTGAHGSGRTRFINEFASRLNEDGYAKIWRLSADTHERVIDVILMMIRAHYPHPIMHPEDRSTRLRAQLRADGITDPQVLEQAIALLIDSTPVEVPSEADIWRLIGRLISAATRRQRVVIVIDDVNQAGGHLIPALQLLVTQNMPRAPLLIMSFHSDAERYDTAFAEGLDSLTAQQNGWVIERRELKRLGLREMQQFLQRAIAISPSVAILLADRVDGNPSYAMLILRSILSRYGDNVLRDPIALDRALTELPADVSEILIDRMESGWRSGQVPTRTLDALESLAFLGQRIPRQHALAMLEAEGFEQPTEKLSDLLSTPTLSGIIYAHNGDVHFHDRLTRAAIMTRAEKRKRDVEIHARCVDIKLDGNEHPSENIAEIAEHCMAAGMLQRAQALFIDASKAQKKKMHFVSALRHIDGAIRTVELSESPSAEELTTILLERADLLNRLSRFHEAEKTLNAVDRLDFYHPDAQPPRLLRLRASVASNVDGNAAKARDILGQALRAADAHRKYTEGVRCRLALAELNIASGALAESEKLLRSLLQHPDVMASASLHGSVLRLLSAIAMHTDALDASRALALEASRYFQEANDLYGLAMTKILQGRCEHLEGNHRAAWNLLRAAQEDFLSISDRRMAAVALGWLGTVADTGGDSARARMCWEQSLDSFERSQDAAMVALSKLRLASLDAQNGHWRSAGQLLLASLSQQRVDPLQEVAWSEAMVRMAKEAIMANRQALARDLLQRAHKRLAGLSNESFAYDRVEEIAHLLYQLGA